MAKALHAIDYLAAPEKFPPRPVCAAFGDEPFLKRHFLLWIRQAVLGEGEGDISLATFEGKTAKLADVLDELSTLAMFGSGKRLAVVEEADDFVTRYRADLEDYVAKPLSTGVLVLDLKTLAANTRLYKAIDAGGLLLDCNAPAAAATPKWLRSWARQAHGFQLDASAADALVELVGPELGLLDQELAKLALTVGPGGAVGAEGVRQMVGSWRARTTWEMLDAAMDGKTAEALVQLDRLLLAGEHPIALLAQISASLRRLAATTQLVVAGESSGRRVSVRDALQNAGVKGFVIQKSESQLRRLGRNRGDRLYGWLLEADLGLKGNSELPPRAVLERLIVRISAPEKRAPVPARR
ncbi:MAG: DNA polymerase III subunit delta [Pirellulales bacterium]|nr:DNA polymerase III subunit delta [Pirellulales bacterium]